MNYDRIILELLDRVSALEDEVKLLREAQERSVEQQSNVVSMEGRDAEEFQNGSSGQIYGGRDTTKYILDGKKYGKNRLVLAVVRKYLEDHPDVSAGKLMMIFNRSLQGSLGVVRTLQDVKSSYSDYERRFFCQPDELIHTTTETCVVCTQWGKHNIGNMIAMAKNLGIEITVI